MNMFSKFFSIYLIINLTSIFNVSTEESGEIKYRLPNHVIPIWYILKLNTYFTNESLSFDGILKIEINVLNSTQSIKIHAKDLSISHIILAQPGSKSMLPLAWSVDTWTDILTIEFEKNIKAGFYGLYFVYESTIEANRTGFLRSSYTDSNKKRSWLAFTQLEPTGARKVFPCFDEPAFKANFTLAISHSIDYKAISNMHQIRSEINKEDPSRISSYFATTPKMSTYLVGIIISNFSYVESKDGTLRIYARDNVVDRVGHVLGIAQKALTLMKKYTTISYEMLGYQKLDIVIVPDIGADIAGMENWGLITVQEGSAIVEKGITQKDDTEWNVKVISHEIIHQWFGNLMTINWWTDLWINEGITTYFHFLLSDKMKKNWRIMDRFAVDKSMVYVWKDEAKANASPIKIDVENPNKMVWSKYYHTYYKSAYLIRMIAQLIGDRKFQLVWRKILKNRSFKSVSSDYITDELAKASKMNNTIFKEIFNNWLTTRGFPVVTVTRNYATGDLRIEQTRFLSENNNDIHYNHTGRRSDEKYWIPLNYATQNESNFNNVDITYWMRPDEDSIKMKGFPHDQWVIFNKQHYGFYCVNYDETNWDLIIRALKSKNHGKIHVQNRLQIIFDAFMLVRSNKLNHRVVLSLIGYLEKEADLVPWIPFWSGAEYLRNYIRNTEYYEPLRKYIAKIMSNLIKRVSFDVSQKDDHLIQYYRAHILTLACESGAQLCLHAASKKLIEWLNNADGIRLPSALETLMLCYGARNAKYEVWNELWHKWMDKPTYYLLEGLGCTGNASHAKELLDRVIRIDKAQHTAHLPYAIDAVAKGSKPGVNVALDFLQAQWQPVIEITPPILMKSLVNNVSRCIADDDQFIMLQDLIERRYTKLLKFGVEPDKLLFEGMKLFRSMKTRYPAYEDFFSSK